MLQVQEESVESFCGRDLVAESMALYLIESLWSGAGSRVKQPLHLLLLRRYLGLSDS